MLHAATSMLHTATFAILSDDFSPIQLGAIQLRFFLCPRTQNRGTRTRTRFGPLRLIPTRLGPSAQTRERRSPYRRSWSKVGGRFFPGFEYEYEYRFTEYECWDVEYECWDVEYECWDVEYEDELPDECPTSLNGRE